MSLKLLNPISILSNVQDWLRKEIVDDDPWDVDTLFPEEDNQPSEVHQCGNRASKELVSFRRLPSKR